MRDLVEAGEFTEEGYKWFRMEVIAVIIGDI